MRVSSLRWWGLGLVVMGVALPAPRASAQLMDPACDQDGDGLVDDFPSDYDEAQQYGNLLNFYAVTMGNSPLHSPAPLAAFKLDASLELSYVPQLTCAEQSVYGGYKTERTNKSPVFPRVRLQYGLPFGFYVGLSGLPPVPAFGVTTTLVSTELGYGHVFGDRLEVGARAYWLTGRVTGDLAGPLEHQTATDDTYRDTVLSAEGLVGYRFRVGPAELTPYLGAGYTQVFASMNVGEDDVDVPGDNPDMTRLRYRGPSVELGAQVKVRDFNLALEGYVVPLSIDPGNPRTFFSPRLRIGYDFF